MGSKIQGNRRAFCSWSGGKDSLLALRTAQLSGYEVDCLVNTITSTGTYSRSHGLPGHLVRKQAESMGVALVQVPTSWKTYEQKFKEQLRKLQSAGIGTGIFGDIDLEPHREWVERVCREVGMRAVLPIWQFEREYLLNTFIHDGFRALVVTIRSDLLDESWLGREVDHEFIRDIKLLKSVDICGENGEFHTFVFDGPNFKAPVDFRQTGVYHRSDYAQLRLE